MEARMQIGSSHIGRQEEKTGRESQARLPLFHRDFLLAQIKREIEPVEEFEKRLGGLGDGEVGEIAAEIGLPPLDQDHLSPCAPGKLVGAAEVGNDFSGGVLRLLLRPLLRSANGAEKLEPLDQNGRKTRQLRMDAELSEGVVRIEISIFPFRLVALVRGVIGDIAGRPFDQRIMSRKKTGIHDRGRGGIANIGGEQRERKEKKQPSHQPEVYVRRSFLL